MRGGDLRAAADVAGTVRRTYDGGAADRWHYGGSWITGQFPWKPGAGAAELAGLIVRPGPPDQAEITALRARHDIEQLTPLVPGRLR